MIEEAGLGEDLRTQMRECARARGAMAAVMEGCLTRWVSGPLSDPLSVGVARSLGILLRDMVWGVSPESNRPRQSCVRARESVKIGFLTIYMLEKSFPGRYTSRDSLRTRFDQYQELFAKMFAGEAIPEDAREAVEEARELFHWICKMGDAQVGYLASGHALDYR